MRIHFICRGNAFRSRIAEAYAKSLGLEAYSSGTVAAENSSSNGDMPACTRYVLQKHNLLAYAKPSWTQLSDSIFDQNDTIVFMNDIVLGEARKLGFDPKDPYYVWDIPDLGELHNDTPTPSLGINDNDFAEITYKRIINHINELSRQMHE